MQPRHYHFILNPKARGGTGLPRFKKIESAYLRGSISYTLHTPPSPRHIQQVVQDVDDKQAVIVAVGGDGTVNLVIAGMLKTNSPAVLGVIPMGTGNALSYTLGVRQTAQAARTLFNGAIYGMDVIETNYGDMPYVMFMASVGLEGRLLALRNSLVKWGHFWSFPLAIAKGWRLPLSSVTISVDGKPALVNQTVSSAVITNGHCYGYNFKAVPRNFIDDGLIELQLFPSRSAQILAMTQYAFGGTYPPEVRHFTCRQVEIGGEEAAQFDGEVVRQPTYTFRVLPRAIRILAADNHYFSQPAVDRITI